MEKKRPDIFQDNSLPPTISTFEELQLLPGVQAIKIHPHEDTSISLHIDTDHGSSSVKLRHPRPGDFGNTESQPHGLLVIDDGIDISHKQHPFPLIATCCKAMGVDRAALTVGVVEDSHHVQAAQAAVQRVQGPGRQLLTLYTLLDSPDDTHYTTSFPATHSIRLATFPTNEYGYFSLARQIVALAPETYQQKSDDHAESRMNDAQTAYPAAATIFEAAGRITPGQSWEEVKKIMTRTLRDTHQDNTLQQTALEYLSAYARFELVGHKRRIQQEHRINAHAYRFIEDHVEALGLSNKQMQFLQKRMELGNLSYELALRQWEEQTLTTTPPVWEALQADIQAVYQSVSIREPQESAQLESILREWAAIRQTFAA